MHDQSGWKFYKDETVSIYCFRKVEIIDSTETCIQCYFKRRCRPYQLWIEPELPFVFKHRGDKNSIFDIQTDVRDALEALFPSEYRLLKNRAMRILPGVTDEASPLLRLKMYELLMQNHG